MRKLLSLVLVILLAASLTAQSKLGGTAKLGGTVKTSVQASGGETNFVNDTFTESSDTELSLHTGELGATWTHHADTTTYTDNSSIVASTDQIFSGGLTAYYASGTPPSADYCVEGVVVVASVLSVNASIALRMDTTTNTMYVFRLVNGTSWDVRRIVAGTQTTLPAATSDTSNLPGVGESRTMKLCISGGATPTLSAYVNGAQLSSLGGLDGSPITATGKAGIRFSGAASSSTGFQFSSFRAFTP